MRQIILALTGLSLLVSCAPESQSGDPSSTLAAALDARDLSVVSVAVPARIAPGSSFGVAIALKNTGSQPWKAGTVTLNYTGDAGIGGGKITLASAVSPNAIGTATGTLTAPAQIGRWNLAWQASDKNGNFGGPITGLAEITCSDGLFCNGDERWINGKCQGGASTCDDSISCTTDTCDEGNDRCWHALGSNCASCAAKNCNPSCSKKVCGDDGCGGSCGTCGDGLACVVGACIVANQPGTCASPLSLLQPGETLLGDHTITGDTNSGINQTVPQCNTASTAKELVYVFTVPVGTTVGMDARMTGFDSVLSLRDTECLNLWKTIGCSDDAAPPGNYGSRVAVLLGPGTYYLLADGYSAAQQGPFTLTVHFAANCVPSCDGKYCGDDTCGGSCGACSASQICGTAGRCVTFPCSPDCNGRKCGPDGCGGVCGNMQGDCPTGQLCVIDTGACKTFDACDHDKPVCKTACSSTQYCGSDCICHRNVDPRPDLYIDKTRLANEILFETRTFSPTSCAINEGCVNGPGARKLLRFTVQAVNQGSADLNVPDPKTRPDLFQFAECHGHYHFKGFATYYLLDTAGNKIMTGRKQAYCMEDSTQIMLGPKVSCEAQSDCASQQISAGWSDIYGNDLDCQWLDITDLPSGAYQLSVSVNPNRTFEEASFENNTTTVPVVVP